MYSNLKKLHGSRAVMFRKYNFKSIPIGAYTKRKNILTRKSSGDHQAKRIKEGKN
jgi:hypothetical protein